MASSHTRASPVRGMKQLHAWVCNPIASGGCTVPCQSLEQEMAPEATKQVTVRSLYEYLVGVVDIHISIFMDTRGRAGTRNEADKECPEATDMVVSKAARTISSRCFVYLYAAASR